MIFLGEKPKARCGDKHIENVNFQKYLSYWNAWCIRGVNYVTKKYLNKYNQ